MTGWIKLHRQLQDNPLWREKPFSKGQAWVDLILIANHVDGYFYKRGNKIEVKRGQVGYSEVGLSERWGWSRNKVRKYLNDLEKEQQIKQQKSYITQIITIVNYDQYQQKRTADDTAEGQQKDTNKNNKEEREELFKQEISQFKDKYSIDMLTNFFAYWSEPNRKGDKMRFELEKTWDVKRRLITWYNRSKK